MIHSFLVSAALLTNQLSASPSIGPVARAGSSYTLSGNIKGMAAEPEFCALEIRTPAGHKDFRVQIARGLRGEELEKKLEELVH